jgi:hypothetical protein
MLNLVWFYYWVRDGVLASDTIMAWGLSADFWAILRMLIRRSAEFVFFGIAIGILVRTHDLMALLIAGTLALLAPSISGAFIEVAQAAPEWRFLALAVGLLATTFGALVLFLIPSGDFVPAFSRWLLPFFCMAEGVRVVLGIYLPQQLRALTLLPFVVVYGLGLIAQVYRYRYGTLVYRYQFQWIILGSGITVLAVSLTQSAYVLLPKDWHILSAGIDEIGALCLALAVGVAVTRYRLYDIDLFINRTIVYASVALLMAGVFAAVYIGQILLFERLLPPEGRPFALVVAAFIVGALYNPTRRQVQNVIDRRFFGLRFNLDQLAGHQRLIQLPGAYSGRILGGYQLLDVIGRGGMGEVYKGVSRDHLAAVKILPLEDLNDYVAQRRFEREMRATQALDHPHIVHTYSAGESDGAYYLAMEYLTEGDLKDLLRRHERLSLEAALPLLTSIAAALDYAHTHGYIHRDLKPSNIMLRRTADKLHPVIMDFGLAKFLDHQSTLTGEGAVGTIDYMAPEQIQSARQVDQRADIYALGVIAFEMLTGERPFKGNPAQILFAHLKQPPPYPHEIQPTLPLAASLAIMEALSKDPADRPAQASVLIARLSAPHVQPAQGEAPK